MARNPGQTIRKRAMEAVETPCTADVPELLTDPLAVAFWTRHVSRITAPDRDSFILLCQIWARLQGGEFTGLLCQRYIQLAKLLGLCGRKVSQVERFEDFGDLDL